MRITVELDQNTIIVDARNNTALVINKYFGFLGNMTLPDLVEILENIANPPAPDAAESET